MGQTVASDAVSAKAALVKLSGAVDELVRTTRVAFQKKAPSAGAAQDWPGSGPGLTGERPRTDRLR